MPVQVLMPQLGESVDEGTISKWLIEVGEDIKEMEPLVEVTTDKVDTEIPSPASGVLLKIEIPVGEVAQAGMVIAWIGAPDEQAPGGESPASAPAPAEAVPVLEEPASEPAAAEVAAAEPAVKASPGRYPELGFISPVVARLAREFKIDLAQVTGSGSGGRITKRDVLNYLERKPAPVQQPTPQATPAPAPAAAPASPAPIPAPPAALPGELVPHDKIRRSIAEHMVHSKRTSPHVTTVMEVDLSRVVAHRAANKAAFARDGVRLTFTPYFIAATVAALKAFPTVNSSWQDDGLLLHRAINIGMATSLGEAGLIVPVIHNADTLSLLGLSQTVNDLAERARNRQLKPDEVKGGTFTITNHGISGSLFASPIINQPQCGILGIGAIQKRVVVISEGGADMIAIRPMAYLSLTFDHRILDGASADGFLGKVVESLQNWS